MRAIFVAMIVAGFGLAFGYPWYVRHFTGDEIGRWPILESRQSGFITQEIRFRQAMRLCVSFSMRCPCRAMCQLSVVPL